MSKLFYIMGKSASGKDHFYKALLENKTLNLKPFVIYTTRPMREGEENGREYYFTDEAQLSALRAAGKIIEERVYQTIAGPWYYFTADNGLIRKSEAISAADYVLITKSEPSPDSDKAKSEFECNSAALIDSENTSLPSAERRYDSASPADSEENFLAIGTLESYLPLQKYYGSEVIIPIYIETEDGIRLERAMKREKKQASPKYAEMCRRFLADTADFSEENLAKAGISRRFLNNGAFEDCLAEIEAFMLLS